MLAGVADGLWGLFGAYDAFPGFELVAGAIASVNSAKTIQETRSDPAHEMSCAEFLASALP